MINHEIQFDGQEDFDGRKQGFAEMVAKFAAEIAAEDQVIVRIIMADDDDLLVGVLAGISADEALIAIDKAVEDRQAALAAVRPPVAAVVEEPAAPVEAKPLSDIEELEKAEREEAEATEEPEAPKKGKKK